MFRRHPCQAASCSRFLLLLLITSNCLYRPTALQLTDHILTELAVSLESTYQQLIESTTTGAAWEEIVSIQRRLEGKGFHRTLHLHIQSAAAAEQQAASLDACKLSLLQPLPSSVFADPYQLEDLTRTPGNSSSNHKPGYGNTFQLLGPLDLELPAPACQDTALLLGLNSTLQHLSAAAVDLQVPLHAKYPQPYAAGYQGWKWMLTGHVAARLPWPYIVLDCRQHGGQLTLLSPPPHLQQQQEQEQQESYVCDARTSNTNDDVAGSSADRRKGSHAGCSSSSSSDSSSDSAGLLWLVPAGNLDHEALVSWGTLLATAVCCVAVGVKALLGLKNSHD